MSDYIKRDDAIEVFAEHLWEHGLDLDSCRYIAKKQLESVPSADVVENVRLSPITTVTKGKPVEYVEVVRCKDCKHHEELLNNNDGNVLCWVHDIDVVVDGNGYCNYGERKEQEHE